MSNLNKFVPPCSCTSRVKDAGRSREMYPKLHQTFASTRAILSDTRFSHSILCCFMQGLYTGTLVHFGVFFTLRFFFFPAVLFRRGAFLSFFSSLRLGGSAVSSSHLEGSAFFSSRAFLSLRWEFTLQKATVSQEKTTTNDSNHRTRTDEFSSLREDIPQQPSQPAPGIVCRYPCDLSQPHSTSVSVWW